MTTIAALVRAAQAALSERAPTDWNDLDALTDEQLVVLAGPGYPEKKTWDESDALPTSTAGLMLLAGAIEGKAEAELDARLRRMAGPGYPEFERWALTGQPPQTDAGKELVAAVQAAREKDV